MQKHITARVIFVFWGRIVNIVNIVCHPNHRKILINAFGQGIT